MNNYLKNDRFNFFVPAEIIKAEKVDPNTGQTSTKMIVQGIASTPDRDLQNESIKQAGIDFSYFKSNGYINEDHKSGPENKVGVPIDCKVTPAGFWIKAELFDTDKGRNWYELIQALDKSGKGRKVGFSVEGRVTRREGNSILGCFLKEVAITANPINTNTFCDIAKALSEERHCVHPWRTLEKACKDCPGKGSCMTKSDNETEQKALTTAIGSDIIPESLEGGLKDTNYYKSLDELSFRQTVEYLQLVKGYDLQDSFTIASKLFQLKGIDE